MTVDEHQNQEGVKESSLRWQAQQKSPTSKESSIMVQKGAERRAQRQLQLGEVKPCATSKAKIDAQNFHDQLTKARRELAGLIQDKGELRQRLAVALSEAGKQSRMVNTMESAVKRLGHQKAKEVESISAMSLQRAEHYRGQLEKKDQEISAVRQLLSEKDSQHRCLLQLQEAMSTTALQMIEQTKAAQQELLAAKEGERSLEQQFLSLKQELREQSSVHEEEVQIAKEESKRYRQAMSLMEQRHGAAISALMEQVVALKQKLIGPEVEGKQRQMADRIMKLEHECATLRDAIMDEKATALNLLKEKEAMEDQARKLAEEKQLLVEEGRRIIQEREAERLIVTKKLQMLAAKEDFPHGTSPFGAAV